MIDFNIPTELFTRFNDVVYFDEPHKYYIDGKELTSVTSIIHKYQEPFNEDYWAENKANEFGVSSDFIKRMWKFINKKGTLKGSIIHDYAENLFLNKIFKYPQLEILNTFGFDPIIKEYEITKKHVNNFYNDVKNKLIPIKTEMIIYDIESMIGGMLDMLFYNVRKKELQIWDHKTNKKLTRKSNNKLLYDLYMLDDCDYIIYSLQLGLYKYIIEKNTSIKLGKSYVVWYSHNNTNYEIIEMKDVSYYIKSIIEDRKTEITL